jgi:stringent starvation protein B
MNYQFTLKPYLINAFYTWALDLNLTPLIEIKQHKENDIPQHLSNEKSIIFNVHPNATKNIIFGKATLQFEALFSSQVYLVNIDYSSIVRIFTKEDGYGLEFNDDQKPIKKEQPSKNSIKEIKRIKHLVLIKND